MGMRARPWPSSRGSACRQSVAVVIHSRVVGFRAYHAHDLVPRPAPVDPKARVNITIPVSMYQEIKELAESDLRSFSAQVEILLRRELEKQ